MKKLFLLIAVLAVSTALGAQNTVITYTATKKLDSNFIASNFGNVGITSHEFSGNEGIVTFDGTVTVIGDLTFNFCSDLTSITIPATIKTIGENAFTVCEQLTTVTFAEDSQLETIGWSAFYGCPLTSITLPASVTTISEDAFCGCIYLTTITIPAVTTIGKKAFYAGFSLTDVSVFWTGNVPDCTSVFNDFEGALRHTTLHVLVGTTDLYTDLPWTKFETIIEDADPALLAQTKADAIAAIDAAMDGNESSAYLNGLVATQTAAIQNATSKAVIDSNKAAAIAILEENVPTYNAGKSEGSSASYQEGYNAAKAELPTEGTTGPAVKIIKGEKNVILYNADKVEFIMVNEEQ